MLTFEAFCHDGERLVAISRQAARLQSSGDSADEPVAEWEWRHGSRSHLMGNAYLVSAANVRTWAVSVSETHDCGDESMAAEEADLAGDINDLLAQHEDDEALIATAEPDPYSQQTETVLCDFHIVFHVIYQTPVLYFCVTRPDGSPFRVDAQMSGLRLPGSSSASTFVSMEEHPVLGTPFWFLHPCETAAAMQLLMQQSEKHAGDASQSSPSPSYLLAWLSLVAPLTRIDPQRYLS